MKNTRIGPVTVEVWVGRVSEGSSAFPSAAGTRIIATRVEELLSFHSNTSESAATLVPLLLLSGSTTQSNRSQATRTKPLAPQPLSRIKATGTRDRIRQPNHVSTTSFSNGGTAVSPDSYRSLWRRHHSKSRVRASQHQPPFYYVTISTYPTLPAFGYTSGLTR